MTTIIRPNGHGKQAQPDDLGSATPFTPHNVEMEEAVLGAILINPNSLYSLKKWFEPRFFFLVKNAWIYEAMLALEARHEDIDSMTLADELNIRRQLEEVGGLTYLMRIVNDTPTHIHIGTYARIVKEAWRRREFVALASKLAQSALTFTPDGSESAEAKQLLEQARELMNDPYDPQTEGLRQHLIHARDLDKLPDVTWLVPGEIPDHGLTIIYGPSGVGKSFFVLDYALRIAQGQNVLYVAAEGESGFKKRVKAWVTHHSIGVGNLQFYLNVAALLDEAERRAFTAQIVDFVKPKLIILDTVAHCMLPGDENSARDMGLFLRAAKEIQRTYDCAVLLVHHTNKEGVVERGSGSLRGAADSMIRLTAEDEVIIVECSKSKDSQPFQTRYIKLLPIQIDAEEYAPVIVAAEMIQRTKDDPLTNQQRLLLETIADVFEHGAALADLVDTAKLSKGSVLRVLSNLKKLGFVAQEDRGAPYTITNDGLTRLGRLGTQDSPVASVAFGMSPNGSQEDAKDSRSHRSHSNCDLDEIEPVSPVSPASPMSPITPITSKSLHERAAELCPNCGNSDWVYSSALGRYCYYCQTHNPDFPNGDSE